MWRSGYHVRSAISTMVYFCWFVLVSWAVLCCSISVPRRHSDKASLKIAHIISPFKLDAEQALVFQALAQAKRYADTVTWVSLDVTIIVSQTFGEPLLKIPDEFTRGGALLQTTNSQFSCKRTIPFPSEMMEKLTEVAPDAHLHMISNADIGVVPEFYEWVARKYLEDGVTGLSVLKVMIPSMCDGKLVANNLDQAINFTRHIPQTHPGSDMFFWEPATTASVIEKTGDVFFGYPPIGGMINDSIATSATHFEEVAGAHVTFHIGREGEHGRGDPNSVQLINVENCNYEPPSDEVSLVQRHKSEDCDYDQLNIEAAKRAGNLRRATATEKAIISIWYEEIRIWYKETVRLAQNCTSGKEAVDLIDARWADARVHFPANVVESMAESIPDLKTTILNAKV